MLYCSFCSVVSSVLLFSAFFTFQFCFCPFVTFPLSLCCPICFTAPYILLLHLRIDKSCILPACLVCICCQFLFVFIIRFSPLFAAIFDKSHLFSVSFAELSDPEFSESQVFLYHKTDRYSFDSALLHEVNNLTGHKRGSLSVPSPVSRIHPLARHARAHPFH